jgi:AraC-like DNA-binding protein
MSSLPAAAERTLALFKPPYDTLLPCGIDDVAGLTRVADWKGCAIVWQLTGDRRQDVECDILRARALGLPLLVLLPPPSEVAAIAGMLPLMRTLYPRMILPYGIIDTPVRLRQVLALAPRGLPHAVTDHMIRRGILHRRKTITEFRRIMELSADTSSIDGLARRMYTSRRTLGRHFYRNALPVPSHCLQFGRLLHVAVTLQNGDGAMFRIANRFGYPDGFTMSNQMKRLTGHRPSEVRELLGWEWILEAWLEREAVT